MAIEQDVSGRVFEFLFLLDVDPDALVNSVVEKEDYLELACCMANDDLIYLQWFEHDIPNIDFAPKGTEIMREAKTRIHSLLLPHIPKSVEFAEQQSLLEPPSY